MKPAVPVGPALRVTSDGSIVVLEIPTEAGAVVCGLEPSTAARFARDVLEVADGSPSSTSSGAFDATDPQIRRLVLVGLGLGFASGVIVAAFLATLLVGWA